MLIRFEIENFLSFNTKTELSMIAGKGRTFPEHIIKGKSRNDLNILKTGIIYGANASGKSNLIKAIEFAKNLIVNGTSAKDTIQVNPFRLQKENSLKPSKFEFEFQVKKNLYAYGFEITSESIESEWLYKINKTTADKPIFKRITTAEKNCEVSFDFENMKIKDEKEKQFLEFVARGTRPNQLFLTECQERNVKNIQSIAECFEWFDKILVIVFPHYTYRGLVLDLMNNTQVIDMFCNFLTLFNTGISGVEIQDEDVENLDLPNHLKKEIISGMQKQSIGTIELAKKSYFVFKNEFNEIKYYKLMTKHYLKSTHEAVLFEVEDESDGTQRLFDLIPVLINLVNKECVFLVDELDRSLHANLARTLIEVFLKNSQDVDSQLIATTHESHLLDLDLLRRDEIWFVEKNKAGESKLYSLEEFQPRYDKEIRKDYLVGRYGAIPFIGNVDNLSWLKSENYEAKARV
jgi:hypothetical protein